MNRAELDDLPAVVDVCTAAKVLGLSRTAAYELIRVGEWPTPVFRLGKLIRIPRHPCSSCSASVRRRAPGQLKVRR